MTTDSLAALLAALTEECTACEDGRIPTFRVATLAEAETLPPELTNLPALARLHREMGPKVAENTPVRVRTGSQPCYECNGRRYVVTDEGRDTLAMLAWLLAPHLPSIEDHVERFHSDGV